MNGSKIRTKQPKQIPGKLLRSILEEIRLLRYEVMLILPTENLEGYANSKRIKRSYAKALQSYPPVGI